MLTSKYLVIYWLSRQFWVPAPHTRLFKRAINSLGWRKHLFLMNLTNGRSLWFTFPAEQDVETYDYMEIPLAEESDTAIKFSYQSNAQMISILKATEERCPEIARTYRIGGSMEGRDLLVIEFSNNPGQHELREFCRNWWFCSPSLSITNKHS